MKTIFLVIRNVSVYRDDFLSPHFEPTSNLEQNYLLFAPLPQKIFGINSFGLMILAELPVARITKKPHFSAFFAAPSSSFR